MYLIGKAGPEALSLGKIQKREPKAGEALIKVHARAVTPTKFQWFPTFGMPTGKPRVSPIVMSHEFSGEVDLIGAGVAGVEPGNVVFGNNDSFTNYAPAGYWVAPERHWHPCRSHSIFEQCLKVTEEALRNVFIQLNCQSVMLEGIILKLNMVLPGLIYPQQASGDEVADATAKCLLRTAPLQFWGSRSCPAAKLPNQPRPV